MKKQKKQTPVATKGKKVKVKPPVLNLPEKDLPGYEDVLLDQVAVKPHPEYPDFD